MDLGWFDIDPVWWIVVGGAAVLGLVVAVATGAL
jgi:hypothetical protein